MAAHLREKDVRSLLDFLRGCYASRDLDAFVATAISDIARLVPADATVYNEYSFKRNRILWQQEPVNFAFPGSERIWERYSAEHPLLAHFQRTRDGRAVRFSDLTSQRHFHRTNLYNQFFRPLNIKSQMTFSLGSPGRLLIAIALNRTSGDFNDREQLLLNLARPHLLQAYRNAEATARLRGELARMKRTLETLDRGVVFLSPRGKVREANERARAWIKEYFRCDTVVHRRLPEALGQWVAAQKLALDGKQPVFAALQPLVVERDGRQLTVRLAREDEGTLLLFEERCNAPDVFALERLGLSRREAEVLSWVARGKTNVEIGIILGAGQRTVEKHLERIFQKLAVETRTAAATLALRHARGI